MIERATRDVVQRMGDGDQAWDPIRRELAYVLWGRGEGEGRQGALPFAAASAVALASLAWGAIRHGHRPEALPADPRWFAVHGEWTNRTRHLLALAPKGEATPLLLLGRPRASVARVRALFARELPGRSFRFVRPLDLRALLSSMKAARARHRQLLAAMRAQAVTLPVRALVPILYRIALGEAHRAWWRRAAPPVRHILYGHSGNADTSALELEQQAAGARTVHLFHGISTGIPFTGRSSLAVARCAHDARWHRTLGGYGDCVSAAAPKPPLRPASDAILLATNLAHPMARPDQAAGVRREWAAIAMVRDCVLSRGGDLASVTYRPHPAARTIARGLRRKLSAAARESGFAAHDPQQGLETYGIVITTPSTMVQDALLAGTIPILLDLIGSDPDSVYGAYPLRARTVEELAACVERVAAAPEASFAIAWESVGPAAEPDLAALDRLCARPA